MDTTVWWGTNPDRSGYYAARVHAVSQQYPWTALCGLPVEQIWQQRPCTAHRLCPECCLLAVAWIFPVFDQQWPVLDRHDRTHPAPATTDSKRDLMPITEHPVSMLEGAG